VGGFLVGSILIVDDEEAIRGTLYDLLSMDHDCTATASAEDAIAVLAAGTYDVVLTDISLPGLSGLELMGHVLQHYANTPVIVISGIGDQEHAQGLIRLGAFDYVLKPFRLEVVEESVNRAISFRSGLPQSDRGGSAEGRTNSDAAAVTASDWHIVND
jgi:DNA-binding NtrC family response regulator